MIYQVWMSIRETFEFPADDPADDTELQAKNRIILSKATDIDVVPFLFKTETAQGRNWTLYILNYEFPEERDLERAVEKFADENPGDTRVLIAWELEGNMIGTELVWDTRIVTKTWSILNPDYQPDPELPDFDDRYVLRITGDVEEEYISGSTGVPLYPVYGGLLKYMPDVGDPPVAATELTDVNLLFGQSPRSFI